MDNQIFLPMVLRYCFFFFIDFILKCLIKFNLKPYFLGETTVFPAHKLVHAQAASVASPSHDTLQSVVVPGDVTAETWRLTLVA